MASQQPPENSDGPDIADLLQGLLKSNKHDPLGKLERLMRVTSDVLLAGPPPADAAGNAVGKGFGDIFALILTLALERPELVAKHASEFAKTVLDILLQELDPAPQPDELDRRFRDPLWQQSPVLRGLLQIYLCWGNSLQGWVDELNLEPADQQRIQFVLRQLRAALSPSNLPIHPSALKRAEKSGGMSAVAALKNFVRDIQENRGMPRQVKPGYFQLGRNLATTAGTVVFRNDLLELIQYTPTTAGTYRRPVCLVPPQINKYYAFDLKPANSLLGHLVGQGFQVFTISWKNPDRRAAHWGIEHYVAALIQAISAICDITRSDQVNLISACAGGLTAMALLGHLGRSGNRLVRSHSLLVTALSPGTGSIIETFTTAENLELARQISHAEGTMDGKDLAHMFVWLRSEDLVWKYWVNNNLLGRQPPPLDILFWDNDPTRIPAALHGDLIDMYQNDVFRNPGAQSLFGHPIDYSKLNTPTYFVGGKDDYLMPWRGVYQATGLFAGRHRFVLSTSGHVQSILRPPNLANTGYYVNDQLPAKADDWFRGAKWVDGSWWLDWHRWLKQHAGPRAPSSQEPGATNYPPLCAAPGSYVHEPMSDF